MLIEDKKMFRILFVFLLGLNFVVSIEQTNISHIVYSTMRNYDDFAYKFYGIFSNDRFFQLRVIEGHGGSLQSIDCLKYDELNELTERKKRLEPLSDYERNFLLNNYQKYPQWQLFDGFEKFEKKHQNSLKKIKNFEQKFPEILFSLSEKMNLINLQKILAEEKKQVDIEEFIKGMRQQKLQPMVELIDKTFEHINSEMPTHFLAIECKKFMADLMAEEGEGNWLDLFTFMPQKGYEILAKCNELSKLQSKELDLLINLEICRQHFEMRKKARENGKELKRTIIIGAGPIGLYTAFQFFMVGMRILVVNDRPENTKFNGGQRIISE